ncbi:hypothetical protein AAC387_Pa01g3716 [Persea americana]
MAKLFLFLASLGLGLVLTCTATIYTVGDTAGWDISTDLSSWVAGKSFTVGDVLVFQYSSLHSVSEVSRDAYDNCEATNAVQSGRDGNTSIPLSAPGQKYFICGTMSHCLGGMRFQVSVKGNQASSPVGAPLAPESNDQVPTPLPRPTNNINNPLPATPSAGFLFNARESLHVIFFSMLGTILWMTMI